MVHIGFTYVVPFRWLAISLENLLFKLCATLPVGREVSLPLCCSGAELHMHEAFSLSVQVWPGRAELCECHSSYLGQGRKGQGDWSHFQCTEYGMHSCPVQLTMTALHEAAITGKVDTVKFLVSRFNADLEARDGVSTLPPLLLGFTHCRSTNTYIHCLLSWTC